MPFSLLYCEIHNKRKTISLTNYHTTELESESARMTQEQIKAMPPKNMAPSSSRPQLFVNRLIMSATSRLNWRRSPLFLYNGELMRRDHHSAPGLCQQKVLDSSLGPEDFAT